MKKKILLVDDEKIIIDICKKYLEKENYEVYQASNAKDATSIFEKNQIDLIITDIMMPEVDGYEFILNILEIKEEASFIFITAKNCNQDKLYSLTLGADDYITKPFNPIELVLRVKNILRRTNIEVEVCSEITAGNLYMDIERQIVKVGNDNLILTSKEFSLLYLLAKNPEKVYSKSVILSLVWDSYMIEDYNTVNVHIHRLREKLSNYGSNKCVPTIKTIWGTGYKLEVYK